MTAAAAGVQPKWVLLEPYVFRADDDESFPDDTVAPIKASGTTSWGAGFRVAFALADPPSISRLYAQRPAGFPDPSDANPLYMVATHRHLALLGITNSPTPSQGLVQNWFIFNADERNPRSSSSLRALPPCTERHQFHFRGDLRRRRRPSDAAPRLLCSRSSGLRCGDEGEEEFVVAELSLYAEAVADICLLRASFANDDDQLGRRRWDTTRVRILPTSGGDELSCWQTDAVIPFQRWLCWVDYRQGILFYDVSKEVPTPTVSLLWFPPDEYALASAKKTPCNGNGGVSVVDHGRSLRFVYVARHDSGPAFGKFKPGTGFTITCHTLVLGSSGSSMAWKLDYTVASDDLTDHIQRGLPMFPRVDIDKPHVVHFLFKEFEKAYGKLWVLSIDMNKKTVESCYLYMDGNEPNQTEDINFFIHKCCAGTPQPFLSCEFPRFC